MNKLYATLYALLIGIIAIYTGEIITFIMLGLILISLNNIHHTLKQIVYKEEKVE